MPNRIEIENLLRAHAELEEPMYGAIWLKQENRHEAWLLEVLTELSDKAEPYPAFVFGPNVDFRYPLHLVAGSVKALERAIQTHRDLALMVAHGEIVQESIVVTSLIELAKRIESGA